MSINLQLIEKNFTSILQKTGTQSYVPWEEFTKTSTQVVKSIDALTKWLGIFRQMQHKNFIQTMKKLKSLDIPDSIQSVKSKKLPKQVLKPIIPRFKLQNGNIQLVDSKQKLKEQALKEYSVYKSQNQQLIGQFQKYIEFLTKKAVQAGFQQNSQQAFMEELKPFEPTMKFQFDEKKLNQIKNSIKVNFLPGTKLIDLNTYTQVVEKTLDCVQDKYAQLIQNSRKQQRKNIGNHKVYFELINSFMSHAESLIVEGQRKLYSTLGCDPSKWQQNEQALLQKGGGQFMMMGQAGLRQKLKKSIPSTKDVSLQQAVQVIKYQIKCITQRSQDIKAVLNDMPKGIESAQMVPVLLSIILNDYIWEAYGFQEQDFMKNLTGMVLFTNPELAEAFGRMEQEIMKLMQKLGLIPEDIMNSMMGPQGQQMAQMMAQMGAMGFDPTNPNQNPFDFLMNQQNQQPPK